MTPATAQKLVTDGAVKCYQLAQKTSKKDPRLAIAQLLFTAALIARAHEIERTDFDQAVEAAWHTCTY